VKLKLAAFLPEIIKHFFKKPATVQYPFQKSYPPEGFRGTPILKSEMCIACKACERDCPAEAIEITTVSAEEKTFRMVIHNDRCIHCGQCVDSCTTDAMYLNMDFELATDDRHNLRVVYDYRRAIPQKKTTAAAL